MANNNIETIKEIQKFLEGDADGIKYITNVEVNRDDNVAICFIDHPEKGKYQQEVTYTPFLYVKDLKDNGKILYNGNKDVIARRMKSAGINIKKVKTGNQPRLENGFKYKVTSTKSFNSILNFFRDGGVDIYQKKYHENGGIVKDANGRPEFVNIKLFYTPKPIEQFFISTGNRLFRGIEDYNEVHKLTFDIETTGLRYQHSNVFAIGVRDNRGFEYLIEGKQSLSPEDRERKIVKDLFKIIDYIKPEIITGYYSEDFDFSYILGRAEKLDLDIKGIKTTRFDGNPQDAKHIKRYKSTVKFGNSSEKYIATNMWGYSVIDTIHAVRKTMAINPELKNAGLKYVCKFEDIAKENRMYIDGSDGNIGRYYNENPMFIINTENNNYIEIPSVFKSLSEQLLASQKEDPQEYSKLKKEIYSNNSGFFSWMKENSANLITKNNKKVEFITGKDILRRYLLDDLWETEKVDDLYNQSTFLLAKLVPQVFGRIATMGTAAIWNLLMLTWSYENDLAIPIPDDSENFSGGLTRCYKQGYAKRVSKIDFASLYPMIQLQHGVFPLFDIDGVIEKMLTYLTTTRNIYKKIASYSKLNESEVSLLESIDHETYNKYIADSFTKTERKKFKVKQLPIKILNNSLFGALGSAFAFNWSDNICAARITCSGRIYLRQAIDYFKGYGLDPLLAVTDGVNFQIPDRTNIRFNNDSEEIMDYEDTIENMWKFGDEEGLNAIIEKYNHEVMSRFMSLDNDGEFDSCYNLKRINYALMESVFDKETNKPVMIETNEGLVNKKKIKLTGNSIKSKVMPEYIEDFYDKGIQLILKGKGAEFVEYYHDYAQDIFYHQVSVKKIASKSKIKTSIKGYVNRGKDKNGKEKASQAHMELLLNQRKETARKLFKKHYDELDIPKRKDNIDDYSDQEIMNFIETYMPPEPPIDSTVYYVNTGERKSHGDVKTDSDTKERILSCQLVDIDNEEKNKTIKYNSEKYLDALNKKVEALLLAFDEDIRYDIIVRVVQKTEIGADGKKRKTRKLKINAFDPEQLQLSNYVYDDYDESMTLEDKEVYFWNKSGYDPYKIWKNFKTSDDDEHGLLHYNIYQHAINHLSDKMEAVGKPRIKSINDELNVGDYVLIKNYKKIPKTLFGIKLNHPNGTPMYDEISEYTLGYKNKENYIEIVKEDIDVPISDYEKELIQDRKNKELAIWQEKIHNLDEDEISKKPPLVQAHYRIYRYFNSFKKKYNLPKDVEIDKLFENSKEAKDLFSDFVDNKEYSLMMMSNEMTEE